MVVRVTDKRLANDVQPDEWDNDCLYEVVNGEVLEQNDVSAFSTLVGINIFCQLKTFLDNHQLGRATHELLFVLDSVRNLRRRPDVAFVSFARWALNLAIPYRGDWIIVPDLAIEVASANDEVDALDDKIDEYFEYGVRQVWLVYPKSRRVAAFTTPGEGTYHRAPAKVPGGDVLPGFELDIETALRF